MGLASGSYTSVCQLCVDISNAPKIPEITSSGDLSYRMEVSVILLFGLTELQAQVAWIENVSIIF